MAYLFSVEGNRVKPTTEVLLVPPFKQIWDRDQDPRKSTAILEFTYMEFMTSALKSNPYKGYETEKRKEVLKRDIFNGSDWTPDELILEGISKIEEFQKEGSANYTLYLDAVAAKEKLQTFLRTFSINDRTSSGNLVLKPKDITGSLLDIDKVATSLSGLEKKVEEDLYESVRTRANKEISIFAKPEHLRK